MVYDLILDLRNDSFMSLMAALYLGCTYIQGKSFATSLFKIQFYYNRSLVTLLNLYLFLIRCTYTSSQISKIQYYPGGTIIWFRQDCQ